MPKDLFSIPNILSVLIVLVLLLLFIRIKKVKLTTSSMVTIGLTIAIATVLGQFKLFKMPQGGSVTPGSLIPILLLSFIYGPEIGMLGGFILGILNLFLGGYVVHPIQLLLDYPLAFMMIGIGGFIKPNYSKDTPIQSRIKISLGILIAILGRLLCHFLSGIIFFSEYAKGQNPYIYSLVYNISFLSIEFIISCIIINLLPIKNLISNFNSVNKNKARI
ncbi:energy-coupled thiamine transporter ThiT [Clostridiaceae bacterium 14S0207]|nr:energy-coupled thiamine transporter ThiT [Clostridiaceae bacterium 14S0207]